MSNESSTPHLSRVPRDAFNVAVDFLPVRDVAALASTSRGFRRHLVGDGLKSGAAYRWGDRAKRALGSLPHSAVVASSRMLGEPFVDLSSRTADELLHVTAYFEQRSHRRGLCDGDAAEDDDFGFAHRMALPHDFCLKTFSQDEGMMVAATPELTAEFRRRFEAQSLRVMLTAAAAPLAGSGVDSVPAEGELSVIAAPNGEGGTPREPPLETVLFPTFARVQARDEGAEAAGASSSNSTPSDGESPVPLPHRTSARHRIPEAGHADPHDDDGLLGMNRLRGPQHSARDLPGVPRYAPIQLRYYGALLAHSTITKFQHYCSDWDWRRAVVSRLVSPSGATAELRFFAMMRLGSFPCFRSQLVWYSAPWHERDQLAAVHSEDPHSTEELFACGYGRVEMDIRPRFSKAQFEKLRAALELPPQFPTELLWNVIVASTIGNVLCEHVGYLNVQYRTSIRNACVADLGLQ